jgi:hypothetical protein
MIVRRVIAVASCGLSLAACSASLSGLSFMKSTPPTETVRIESDPPGAEAKTALGQSCRTPCELSLDGASETSLTLSLTGYQAQTVSIRPETSDPAISGPKLAPNPVFTQLQPQPATPAKKPAKKKRPTVAAAPRPATAAPVTAAAPAAAPAPPSGSLEPAASATNYPWPSR